MKKIKITTDTRVVTSQPLCIEATFHGPADNPLLPLAVSDNRGTLFGLDYADIRPFLVEVIHSRADVIRGNHVHAGCTETFTVLTGTIEMYLLCKCPDKHLLKKKMDPGMSVQIMPGIAHAVRTVTENESIAVFGDSDPRNDRDRVEFISFA
jgi:dTDP-4-dehydrorhamnose 3,5-epimerase-like enzyme